MVVLLQEAHLSLLLVSRSLRVLHVLAQSLLLRERPSALDLLSFQVSSMLCLFVPYESLQLSSSPGIELCSRIYAIRIVYVGLNVGDLA